MEHSTLSIIMLLVTIVCWSFIILSRFEKFIKNAVETAIKKNTHKGR